MSTVILLDTGLLGLITYPKVTVERDQCRQWLVSLSAQGFEVRIPEIADYELRRELLRMNKQKALQHLDDLEKTLGYLPLTTQVMRLAAHYWAQVRQQGKPTTSDKALDGDVILAAQASILERRGDDVVIATTNVGHLSRLVKAKGWRDIP